MHIKILMVCLGNICRSPLAHGLVESKLNSIDFTVDSAGTASYHIGEPPDRRSIAVAAKYGVDISKQRARQFVQGDFDAFDLIFAMDEHNLHDILKLARNADDRRKVELILNKGGQKSNASVPDPYYGGKEGFERVFSMLDEACQNLVAEINQGI